MNTRWVRILEVVLVVLLVALVASEALLYVPAAQSGLEISVAFTPQGGSIQVVSTIHAGYRASLRQTAVWTRDGTQPLQIEYFYDPGYLEGPWVGPDWYTMPNHIAQILGDRHTSISVSVLNATEMAAFLSQPPSPPQVVVFSAGILPYAVYHPGFDPLRTWVAEGGTLVWVGPAIGGYYVLPGQSVACDTPFVPGWNGTAQFLNLTVFSGNPPGGKCGTATPSIVYDGGPGVNGTQLGIDFRDGYPGVGLNRSLLPSLGGMDLGSDAGAHSTVARLPLGKGSMLYFSGPLGDSRVLSIGLLNLLQVGMEDPNATLLHTTTFTLGSGQTSTLEVTDPLPNGAATAVGWHFCVLTFSTDYYSPFAQEDCAESV